MNKASIAQHAKTTNSLLSPPQGLLQRKCACGNYTIAGGQCAECAKQKSNIQRKLTIGASNDPLEREADHVADQILESSTQYRFSNAKPSIQKYSASINEESKEASNLPASVHQTLSSLGRPLDTELREDMEGRFGYGFNHVRIHTGGLAEQSAKDLNSHAYTVGNKVVFGEGRYAPTTKEGKRLLAHELTHVVQQDYNGTAQLFRKPKGEVSLGEPEINKSEPQKEEWSRLQVFASGMDDAAKVLAGSKITLRGAEKQTIVFIGLHPKFVKVYDQNGKSLGGRFNLKEVKGLRFSPGVYVEGPKGLVALTLSNDDKKIGVEAKQSIVGQRPYTKEEQAANVDESKRATDENRLPKPAPLAVVNVLDLITDLVRFRSLMSSVPDVLAVYFVPTYGDGTGGAGGGESKSIYASPIEGRADGQPANAPPWPVSVDGPKLVPVDSDPTFSAKVDWAANGNYSVAAQVITQVGETIHYRWELFDITQYARKQQAKDASATKIDSNAKPEKNIDERIEDFKKAKTGTGADVTGMGGANREFKREFEDWWKDNKSSTKGAKNPSGDSVSERLSNTAANRLSLELSPVSLLVTALGATLRWFADLFSGPRQQQEIPLKTNGVFLVRVITTPAINEDREGKPIVRPPSVAAKVAEVTPMDRAVAESLDDPSAQLAELQAQIDLAEKAGNTDKAEYLRSLLLEAKEHFEGTPLTLLTKKRDQKQKELKEFRSKYPTLSDYSRASELDKLDDQINLYKRHQGQLAPGSSLHRINASLISEVTGEQYPLLLSAGPMAMAGDKYQWMISDVTNRDGDAFIGLGNTPSEAFLSALNKFGGNAAYGRGRIGVRTSGLGLDETAKSEYYVDSAPTNWALAEKRIDDLVMTLAALGLIVTTAGTAGALAGAGLAATRLIQRWRAGKLYLDAQTVSDVLGVLGGLGAAGQIASGLRIQKFEKVFAIVQEGKTTEAEIVAASKALNGAQNLARGVELANEAINYGGLLWGNVSFIDQMISISEQESSGAITHAAARRARAGAISSAVQNNGLFIAGNVLKAKQQTKETQKADNKPTGKETNLADRVQDESLLREEGNKPAQKVGDPVPLGERRATLEELRAALPEDIREMASVDHGLEGDDVRVDYELDKKTGLITDIKVRCSPDARPATVALHEQTVRTMQKYQGFSGRVRQAISRFAGIIGIETLTPENKPLFEAKLEVSKLPDLITAQMERMKGMEPNAQAMAEAELASLQNQLQEHLNTLNVADVGEGTGFVAAKGLSKVKQTQYADLLTELRTYEVGSKKHRDTRWKMYELIGGKLPFKTWKTIYESNVERANKANEAVKAEHDRLGWGKTEQTVDVGDGEGVRRLDIASIKGKRGVEIKEYEGEIVYASKDIVSEVQRDAKLVKPGGWKIKWIMIDCEPSGPLLKMLSDAGIIIERRTRTKNGTEFKSRTLPKNSKPGTE